MKFKEIIRLGLILMIVTVISASVLSLTHGVTDPVIQQQQLLEIEENMQEFFPEADEVEIKEEDEMDLYFALSDGETIGVATMIAASGYGGDINMIVALDLDGVIQGIGIISHEETPGIGDVIEEEEFIDQFIGVGPDDSVSGEVDTITGATVSVSAAVSGAESGREVLLEYLGIGEPITDVDISQVPDGTYQGSGEGFDGEVVVEILVEDGMVVEINEIEHQDTEEYFIRAWDEMPGRIMEHQSLEVDAVSGATASSRGIKAAVHDALTGALE